MVNLKYKRMSECIQVLELENALGLLFTLIWTFRKTHQSGTICFFVWTENIWKTELFENADVTIVIWFP